MMSSARLTNELLMKYFKGELTLIEVLDKGLENQIKDKMTYEDQVHLIEVLYNTI